MRHLKDIAAFAILGTYMVAMTVGVLVISATIVATDQIKYAVKRKLK